MNGPTLKALAEVDGNIEMLGRFTIVLAAVQFMIDSGTRAEYAVTKAFEVYDKVVEEEHRRSEKMKEEEK